MHSLFPPNDVDVRNLFLFFITKKISHFYKSGSRTLKLTHIRPKGVSLLHFIVFICKQTKKCKFFLEGKIFQVFVLNTFSRQKFTMSLHTCKWGQRQSWYVFASTRHYNYFSFKSKYFYDLEEKNTYEMFSGFKSHSLKSHRQQFLNK